MNNGTIPGRMFVKRGVFAYDLPITNFRSLNAGFGFVLDFSIGVGITPCKQCNSYPVLINF